MKQLKDYEIEVLVNLTKVAEKVVDSFFEMVDNLDIETIVSGRGTFNLVLVQLNIKEFDEIINASVDEFGKDRYMEILSHGGGAFPSVMNKAVAVGSFIKYCTGEFNVSCVEELEELCQPILEYFDEGFIRNMVEFREVVGYLPKMEDLLGCF